MKKAVKFFSLIIVTPILLSVMLSVFGGYGSESTGDTTNIDKINSRGEIYTILEIVPHVAKAELAYMVKGSEPFNNTKINPYNIGGAEYLYGYYDDGKYVADTKNVIDDKGRTEEYYKRLYYMTNVFTRSVFGTNDLDIKVKIVTPDILNNNKELIDEADLIYFTPHTGYGDTINFYVENVEKISNKNERNERVEDIKKITYASPGCDFTWEVVMKLYEYAIEEKYPIVFNGITYGGEQNYTTTNIEKLNIMLRQLKNYKEAMNTEFPGVIDWETGFFDSVKYAASLSEKGLRRDNKPSDDSLNTSGAWRHNDIAYLWDTINNKRWEWNYYLYDYGNVGALQLCVLFDNVWLYENSNLMGTALTILVDVNMSIYGGINNSVPKDTGMRNVDVLKYIINNSNLRDDEFELDRPITILEIQPSKSFIVKKSLKDSGLNIDNPDDAENPYFPINVIERTSQGFNTVNEDLIATYDLIIMGLNMGNMNVIDGETVYNDISLNGKIYLSLGDKTRAMSKTVYTKETDVYDDDDTTDGYTRFNGNDISQVKQKELQNYINTGLKVITDANMLSGDNANSSILDTASNIYSFINNNKEKLVTYENNSKLVKKIKSSINALNVRPTLEITEKPMEYDSFNNYIYSTPNADGDCLEKLNFRFNIKDEETSNRYTYRFIIDTDGDGKFDDAATEGSIIAYERNNVSKGTYSYTYEVPKNYTGLITWKLEVIKDNGLKDFKVGRCAIAISGVEEEIKILHIIPTSGNTLTINGNFKDLLDQCIGYKFTCKQVTTAEFENWYDPSKSGGKIYNPSDKSTDRLNGEYDIIILGFGDIYGHDKSDIKNEYGALDNMNAYIRAGRSVLYTHDTTNYRINNKGYGGYNLTKAFRSVLGMNRFDYASGNGVDKLLNTDTIGYTDTFLLAKNQGQSGYTKTPYKNVTASFNRAYDITKTVNQANQGVISNFPYFIENADTITTADTHAQYFALDFEEEDLTVWYTLADKIYDESPLDGRSNYYIYTNGTITYTGAGHNSGFTDNERMLLVNTIIAAVSNANHLPYVDLDNVIHTSDNKYLKYVSEVDNSLTFNMRAVDKDFKDTHFRDVKVYVNVHDEDPVNPYEYDEGVDYAIAIYNESTTKLQSNIWETITLDKIEEEWFGDDNSFTIVIEVTDARDLESSSVVEERITVRQRSLFDLK